LLREKQQILIDDVAWRQRKQQSLVSEMKTESKRPMKYYIHNVIRLAKSDHQKNRSELIKTYIFR